MLIILEGADKQGKTTLARALATKLDFRYVHHGPPVNGSAGYLRELLELQDHTIMDRSFIGELVYGPLLRGKSCIDVNQLITLLRLASRYGVIVVHCHGAKKKLDSKDLVSPGVNAMAQANFKLLMSVVERFVETTEYTFSREAVAMETWIRLFVNQYVIGRVLPCFKYLQDKPTGYGEMVVPSGFLIGDSLNLKASWAELPFDGGSSANYLNEILLKYGPKDLRHYLMNARVDNKWNDTAELHEIRAKNPDAKVVALGNVAHDWLKAYGILHNHIPHPSYWKRFHSKEPARYGTLIKEALQWKALTPATR